MAIDNTERLEQHAVQDFRAGRLQTAHDEITSYLQSHPVENVATFLGAVKSDNATAMLKAIGPITFENKDKNAQITIGPDGSELAQYHDGQGNTGFIRKNGDGSVTFGNGTFNPDPLSEEAKYSLTIQKDGDTYTIPGRGGINGWDELVRQPQIQWDNGTVNFPYDYHGNLLSRAWQFLSSPSLDSFNARDRSAELG